MIEQSFRPKDRFVIQREINPQYEEEDLGSISDESNDAEKRSEHKRWQKQPTVVAKRNARERTRVHTVNQAFITLKFHLPSLRAHTKRVSKLKILNAAIRYIDSLDDLLKTYDTNMAAINIPTERRHQPVNGDRALLNHQQFPYMQSLLDYSPYLCPPADHPQNFMMNPPPAFFLQSSYQQ